MHTTAKKLLSQNEIETSIQWIRGHCDITGSEGAGRLAKQGTSKTQHDVPFSYATSKQIIQMKIWHDRWARLNTERTYCLLLILPHHYLGYSVSANKYLQVSCIQ